MHKSTRKKLDRQARCRETLEQLLNDSTYFLHHTSYAAGSIPKDSGGIISEYHGRFGDGLTLDLPYWGESGSGKYHERYYFIKKTQVQSNG